MRKSIYIFAIALAMPVMALMTSCEPSAIEEKDVLPNWDENQLMQELEAENPQGFKIFDLNEFLDSCMTEEGDFASQTEASYRTRATNGNGIYLFSIDTIPSTGRGIYIRGRISTDDFAGNFYKTMVIQQVTDWATGEEIDQQNLRISVDMGSSGGMFQIGQEILIRCNGLAVGRYSNQPQLCIPSYNNNIFALVAAQKVGWAPGRIPSAVFRKAVRFIGTPDQSKLKYDTLSLVQLFNQVPEKPTINKENMDKIRKADGRLVVLTKVHFTGQANDDGEEVSCMYKHPDSVTTANVFASTTNNIGFPQSRILKNASGTKAICCSNSEYCKFAYFFIPGAAEDTTKAVAFCDRWTGTVTGILGWYCDNATGNKSGSLNNVWAYNWSVTPRGIQGIGIPDIKMVDEEGNPWVPKEFDPVYYEEYMKDKPEEKPDPVLPPILW